ncbi:GNAT family N-acetyltransferase [Enterobacteriaceae bacterium ESL0689]|nr:GNAT family N-acetyltransferase [Enterobacteriaceae bacterium ESL0689]
MNTNTTVLLRRISATDNRAIADVIRQVSAEYGLSADKGYTVADPNLDTLFELYNQPQSAYWVVVQDGQVVGGGGIAPLAQGAADTCELQKMYFMPSVRGQGIARKLAEQALDHARQLGFRQCYLETTAFLQQATRLYERLGFEYIDKAMGYTGHVDCEVWMLKQL